MDNNTQQQDALRLRWLLSRIEAGSLCVARMDADPNAPLQRWDNIQNAAELIDRIDAAIKVENALAEWTDYARPDRW